LEIWVLLSSFFRTYGDIFFFNVLPMLCWKLAVIYERFHIRYLAKLHLHALSDWHLIILKFETYCRSLSLGITDMSYLGLSINLAGFEAFCYLFRFFNRNLGWMGLELNSRCFFLMHCIFLLLYIWKCIFFCFGVYTVNIRRQGLTFVWLWSQGHSYFSGSIISAGMLALYFVCGTMWLVSLRVVLEGKKKVCYACEI